MYQEVNTKKSNRLLLWAVFIAFILVSILYVSLKRNNYKQQIKPIKKEIEVIREVQKKTTDSVVYESKKSVEYSKKIIKKISNEKITIPDTTYVFMCEYITKYNKK